MNPNKSPKALPPDDSLPCHDDQATAQSIRQSTALDVLGPAMSDTPIQVPDTEHSLEMLTIAPVRVH